MDHNFALSGKSSFAWQYVFTQIPAYLYDEWVSLGPPDSLCKNTHYTSNVYLKVLIILFW